MDAIVETQIFDYAFESRDGSVLTKKRLLEIGEQNKKAIDQTKLEDSKYR